MSAVAQVAPDVIGDPLLPNASTVGANDSPVVHPIYVLAAHRLERLRLTKGSRFEAARRHKKAGRASTISIVIFSTYLFSISVILLTFQSEINGEFTSVLKSLSLIMSFFIGAFSLMQASKRHELRSAMFLKCAQTIDDIWTNLDREKQLQLLTPARMKFYDEEYQRKMAAFSDNHSEMDFQIFRSINKERGKICYHPIKAYLRNLYWNTVSYFYIWKNVYLALLFPWIIIAAYLVYKYKVAYTLMSL